MQAIYLFAETNDARRHRYDAGRFSFNVKKGRCETCEGEGFVFVEMLFLPSVYAPCPTCRGRPLTLKRYPDGITGEPFYASAIRSAITLPNMPLNARTTRCMIARIVGSLRRLGSKDLAALFAVW